MSAESAPISRARVFIAALLLALVAAPLASALRPTAASAATYGQLIVDTAAKEYGKAYSYGSTGPSTFDCSGFTSHVFRQFGVNLPRVSRDQYAAIPHVAQDQKQVGDLIFTYDSGGIYHVGIYAGGNQMWAATKTGDIVRPQTIWTSAYVVGRPDLGGAIGDKWEALGGANSPLGQAIVREHAVPGAQKVDFQRGDIYWTPPTGAREVHGGINEKYDALGGPSSALGVPVTDEYGVAGGRSNRFAGRLDLLVTRHRRPRGARRHRPEVRRARRRRRAARHADLGRVRHPRRAGVLLHRRRDLLVGRAPGPSRCTARSCSGTRELGGSGGCLGLPVSDERAAPGGRESAFQRGTLRWNAGDRRRHASSADPEPGGPRAAPGLRVRVRRCCTEAASCRPSISTARSRISTLRTLPVTVIGKSSSGPRTWT